METGRKNRNAGFTLVELLVAVTILAIIVVPMMHSIISSAKTNAKSRKISEATVLAQNEMEEILAEDMADILVTPGIRKEVEWTDAHGKDYYKNVYDVADVSVGGSIYDMVVELSENTTDAVADNEITEHNTIEIPQIYDMNEVTDAFYIQDTEMDGKMAEKFAGNKTDVMRDMKREITIDITQTGTAQEVELGMTYTWGGVTKSAFSRNQRIYDSTSEKLRNVYLFFQPMSYHTITRESIVIKNHNNIPVNVYLICQSVAPAGSYVVEVKVLEPGRTDADYMQDTANPATSPLEIKTHVRTNLSYGVPTVANQVTPKYGTSDSLYQDKKTITVNSISRECTAAELTDFNDLSARAAETRIYKVVVKVYENDVDKNVAGALAVMEGTKKE